MVHPCLLKILLAAIMVTSIISDERIYREDLIKDTPTVGDFTILGVIGLSEKVKKQAAVVTSVPATLFFGTPKRTREA